MTLFPQPPLHRSTSGWDDEDWLDFFEERAAILEYDGHYSRQAAEDMAELETQILRNSLEAAK
jgi:hypothetical protein